MTNGRERDCTGSEVGRRPTIINSSWSARIKRNRARVVGEKDKLDAKKTGRDSRSEKVLRITLGRSLSLWPGGKTRRGENHGDLAGLN